ncbi:MAG: hypothetical protein ACK5H2_11740 [Beutenbergiaceae bacterium]
MAFVPLYLGGAALLLGAWAGIWALLDRPVVFKQLIVGGVIEALMLAEIVIAIIDNAGAGDRLVFWGYLITALLVLPLAAAWALAERTKWSSVTLLVACVALAVIQVRIASLWPLVIGA